MKKTLFLVMDMMNDLVDPEGFSKATYGVQVAERGVLAKTAAAIAAARSAGAQVGFVRVSFSADYRECPPASPIFSGARANGIFQLGTYRIVGYAPVPVFLNIRSIDNKQILVFFKIIHQQIVHNATFPVGETGILHFSYCKCRYIVCSYFL